MTDSETTGDDGDRPVDCIACGATVARSTAREYDRYGNRWGRDDKRLEYLCSACDDDLCRQPRDGLEDQLLAAGAGEVSLDAFLRAFLSTDERPLGTESGD